jgi:hypothetical protein
MEIKEREKNDQSQRFDVRCNTIAATADEVAEDEEEKGGLVKQGVIGRLRLEVGQNCAVEMYCGWPIAAPRR